MMASATERSSIMLDAPSGWKVRRLETFATKVGSGATPRGGQSVYLTSRVSHALIRSQHVYDRRFDREGIAFISEEHSQELRNVEVRPDDILLNITGDGVTFARACIVPNDILPACVNQHVSIVRVDRNVCDPGYLLAYLTHPVTKRYMESFNTGGSRRAITKGHIQSFEVPLPPIPVQRRIAEILLAYDELMENNQQRIRLLEVMSRALYREWFVRFRFPGHEKLSRVASPGGDIPKGWDVKPLSQLCSRMESGGTPKRKNAEYWDGGEISWFKTGELWDGFLFESEEKITELGQRESTARLFEPGTLLMAIYGSPTVGRLGIVTRPSSCNQAALGLVADTKQISQTFLYFVLLSLRDHFNGMAQGAAQQNISKEKVAGTSALVPPRALVTAFDRVAEPIFAQLQTLQCQIQNLRQTRDLLLPRLLSGQINLP